MGGKTSKPKKKDGDSKGVPAKVDDTKTEKDTTTPDTKEPTTNADTTTNDNTPNEKTADGNEAKSETAKEEVKPEGNENKAQTEGKSDGIENASSNVTAELEGNKENTEGIGEKENADETVQCDVTTVEKVSAEEQTVLTESPKHATEVKTTDLDDNSQDQSETTQLVSNNESVEIKEETQEIKDDKQEDIHVVPSDIVDDKTKDVDHDSSSNVAEATDSDKIVENDIDRSNKEPDESITDSYVSNEAVAEPDLNSNDTENEKVDKTEEVVPISEDTSNDKLESNEKPVVEVEQTVVKNDSNVEDNQEIESAEIEQKATETTVENTGVESVDGKESEVSSKVGTEFKWEEGGENVEVSGSFNSWDKVKLDKKDAVFSITIDLEPGEYLFKYIVDGDWKTNPKQPTRAGDDGIENNIIEVKKV